MQHILDLMVQPDKEVRYLITGSEDTAVISSNSSTSQGKFYHAASSFRLSQGLYIRLKRTIDLIVATWVILFYPILIIARGGKPNLFFSAWRVLWGRATWVGYLDSNQDASSNEFLPPLKSAIWNVAYFKTNQDYLPIFENEHALNLHYAKNYSPAMDLSILYQKIFVS